MSDVNYTAPHSLTFPYRRTLGPVVGHFMEQLEGEKIYGVRMGDGRVLVPPTEYDPITAEVLTDLVEVGPGGEVVTWSWVHNPSDTQPLQSPFAWALIRLDGADTAMIHAVEVPGPDHMENGMKVMPRWSTERGRGILDIECFVPAQTESKIA